MVKECAETIRDKFPNQDRTLSGIGGIETGKHAAEFILLGSDTVQVCTGVMKCGYGMIRQMKDELLNFMSKHKFETIDQFKGHSLQFFTTHADLVRRQAEAKAAAKAGVVKKDDNWKGDEFVKQTEALARG
jgi:dihydropyrimidine dehydrogenase (NADP+)/dihydropyrimidine dehydrogenase (NAD+) subunit PreA